MAIFFRPNIIATDVNILIMPARTNGACGPTNMINKIITSIVIIVERPLLKNPVIEVINEASIVIFIPDKTTKWSNPTIFNSS